MVEMKSVVLALDATPLSNDPFWPVDYNGRFLAEFTVAPIKPQWASVRSPFSLVADIDTPDAGYTWMATLDEVRWPDGSMLTARQVCESWAAAFSHRNGRLAGFLGAGVAQCESVGDWTVRVRLSRPVPYFPELLSLPSLAPRYDERNVTLGPYRVIERSASRIVLNRNGVYAEKRFQELPRSVEFVTKTNGAHAVSALERGEIDLTPTTGLRAEELAALRGHVGLRATPMQMFGQLNFGDRARRFLDSALSRAALSSFIDRTRLAEVGSGLVAPWYGPLAEHNSVEFDARPSDIAAALRESAEICYADFPPNGEIVTDVAEQLRDRFGVWLRPRALSFSDYVKTVLRRSYGLMYSLTMAEFEHPAALLMPWRRNGFQAAAARFADQRLDGYLDEATTSASEDLACWLPAARRWCWLAPQVPLVQVIANYLARPRLSDFHLTGTGLPVLDCSFGSLRSVRHDHRPATTIGTP